MRICGGENCWAALPQKGRSKGRPYSPMHGCLSARKQQPTLNQSSLLKIGGEEAVKKMLAGFAADGEAPRLISA